MFKSYVFCFLYVIIKYLDFPSKLFSGSNYLLDYYLYKPLYTKIIPYSLFPSICIISDILTSYYLNSYTYLYYSIFLPLDIASLENLIFAFFRFMLPFSPSYVDTFLGLFFESVWHFENKLNHIPTLSANWCFNMCMYKQFYKFSMSYGYLLFFIFSLNEPRLFPVLKTRSTFYNYLLFTHKSCYLSLYFSLYVLFVFLNHTFNTHFLVNTNFLYFSTLLTNILYVIELKTKYC